MAINEYTFSQRLELLLKEHHMTQKKLAEKASVTEAAISLYIKGERTPRAAVLNRIAEALDTTADYLMQGTPQGYLEEIDYAKQLIARNASHMSTSDKIAIMTILLGGEE